MIFTHPDLITGISLRPRNMSFSYGDAQPSLSNRREFLKSLGINYADLVCGHQVHGSAVVCVSEDKKGCGAMQVETALPNTDALTTNLRNVPMAIFTADCLPVFLYDPIEKAIGLVHAGWRGSKDKIVFKTVQFMRDKFHVKSEDLLVGFGPALKSCCYEVGEEFNDFFSHGLMRKNGRLYLDLPGINKQQLLDAGIQKKNISDLCDCTSCKIDAYFSYRKEQKLAGRMISVIMLK